MAQVFARMQQLGRALMLPIAVLPVAGMLLRLGQPDLLNVRIEGLMTVAQRVADPEAARPVFRQLAALASDHSLQSLSMGMTEDFEVAIEEGSTHVRVGRAIFGERA